MPAHQSCLSVVFKPYARKSTLLTLSHMIDLRVHLDRSGHNGGLSVNPNDNLGAIELEDPYVSGSELLKHRRFVVNAARRVDPHQSVREYFGKARHVGFQHRFTASVFQVLYIGCI